LGGSPAVWNTALVFYQSVLLAWLRLRALRDAAARRAAAAVAAPGDHAGGTGEPADRDPRGLGAPDPPHPGVLDAGAARSGNRASILRRLHHRPAPAEVVR